MIEIYRDRWLLIVDKPSGLPTQAPRGGGDNLMGRLQSEHGYVGLHHRLDQVASGLVLFTLDRRANAAVARAFREGEIGRFYRAVLVGHAQDTRWSAPIDGRPALTEVTVLSRAHGMSAVEVRLHTGRKHQIRRHAALAGTPIAGDRRYGGDAGRAWPRLALHAARLELTHPITCKHHCFESGPSPDLLDLWKIAGGDARNGTLEIPGARLNPT